ncbi:hypothetical protein BYT27DRAFT_7168552 [Phlegmacium glaucopus]|nr:hypothetical protein BYT27DRAFT_7168552 [Phlegmacium glaucopus]
MPLFLKGYKLDLSKISQTFNVQPPDRPDDWVISIIECIPRDAYKHIGNGYETNDKINVMIVIEDGRDEKELMKSSVISSDKTLADIGRKICTLAIWPCFDDLDSPPTFWNSSQSIASSLLEWNGLGEQKKYVKGIVPTVLNINYKEYTYVLDYFYFKD